MNAINSIELVVQPFPDGSFMLYYWSWNEIRPGLFEPKDTRAACESVEKLITVFEKLTESAGFTKCPGENAKWYAEKPFQIQKRAGEEGAPHI